MISKVLKSFARATTPQEKARRQFYSVRLKKGDIAIDCGANIGNVTQRLCKSGATVYCFEPNPYAFDVLQERFCKTPNVRCIPKGVGDQDGRMKLYLHEHSDEDAVYWSTGSSLLEFKGNVRKDRFVDVEIVDLCAFIEALGRRVRILKMDVEGVECSILRKMIERDVVGRIDHIFVETHDDKVPELREETNQIRELIAHRGIDNINLDWI